MILTIFKCDGDEQMIYLCIIEIIDNCNLRCKHCYNKFESNHIMDLETFEKVARLLKPYECSTIRISGGEPTLLGESIFNYGSSALKYANHVEITTNGVLEDIFSDGRWKLFSNIQISLDGTEKIHDSIRGQGTYRKAFNSLVKLKSSGNKVSVMMTVGRYNLKSITDLRKELSQYDIPMYIERITGTGRADANEELTSDEVKYLFDIISEYDIKTTDPLYIFYNDKKREYLIENCIMGGCSAGVSALCIGPNLDVFPCPRFRIVCGNLNKLSLADILNSEVITSLNDRDLLTGKCGRCDNRWICGGCRASAYACDKSFLAEDTGCFINV